MGHGGTARKLILKGLEFEVSGDNDPKFTIGGYYVAEKQDTNKTPFFLTDNVSGALTGVEIRVSHQDGSLSNLDGILQECAEPDTSVSCMYITADGRKYTGAGGVKVIPDGAADGMLSMREGKLVVGIHPVGGKWLPA